jgi:hypothetical protein
MSNSTRRSKFSWCLGWGASLGRLSVWIFVLVKQLYVSYVIVDDSSQSSCRTIRLFRELGLKHSREDSNGLVVGYRVMSSVENDTEAESVNDVPATAIIVLRPIARCLSLRMRLPPPITG